MTKTPHKQTDTRHDDRNSTRIPAPDIRHTIMQSSANHIRDMTICLIINILIDKMTYLTAKKSVLCRISGQNIFGTPIALI